MNVILTQESIDNVILSEEVIKVEEDYDIGTVRIICVGGEGGGVNADWDATSGAAEILHKPPITHETDGWQFWGDATSDLSVSVGIGATGIDISDETGTIDLSCDHVTVPTPESSTDAASKGYVDSALADKMNKANPTGTGALSINRKANTTVGDKSSCLGGRENEVTGYCATATGNSNIASGAHSFAEGQGTWGRHANAHAEGIGTETGRSEQHVFGRYNHKMTTGLRVSGNGTSVNNKKNAEFLDDSGNLMLAGDVYVGCAADSTGGNKVATESYVDAAIGAAIGGSY